MLPDLGLSHALILQGPAGPFMARLGEELRRGGVRTTKVNFHAGDVHYYPGPDAISFRDPFDRWPAFLEALLDERDIDGVILFADCRPLHKVAIEIAEARGLKVWCIEEGYMRPDWVTFEEHGLNGNSRLPRDPDFYRSLDLPPFARPLSTGPRYKELAWYSTIYALAFTVANQDFPHYRHHRNLNAWYHTAIHCWEVVRKYRFLHQERHILPLLTGPLSGRYFFVPLQVFCDYSLAHSPYADVMEFIEEVTASFVAHAPRDVAIVFKHHPMDRAYREYGPYFRDLARAHGIEDRLYYCHDLDLSTILAHAIGTVTINSTVGLTAISRGLPVKAMGTAVYAMEGMTHQGPLDGFWETQEPIDRHLYEQFTRYLAKHTHGNGSFYKRLEEIDTPTGIRWFPQPTASDVVDAHDAADDVPVRRADEVVEP